MRPQTEITRTYPHEKNEREKNSYFCSQYWWKDYQTNWFFIFCHCSFRTEDAFEFNAHTHILTIKNACTKNQNLTFNSQRVKRPTLCEMNSTLEASRADYTHIHCEMGSKFWHWRVIDEIQITRLMNRLVIHHFPLRLHTPEEQSVTALTDKKKHRWWPLIMESRDAWTEDAAIGAEEWVFSSCTFSNGERSCFRKNQR